MGMNMGTNPHASHTNPSAPGMQPAQFAGPCGPRGGAGNAAGVCDSHPEPVCNHSNLQAPAALGGVQEMQQGCAIPIRNQYATTAICRPLRP